jgi:hypothetical protein
MPALTCHCFAYSFPHRPGSGSCMCDSLPARGWLQNLCSNCGYVADDDTPYQLSACCNAKTLPNSSDSACAIRSRRLF